MADLLKVIHFKLLSLSSFPLIYFCHCINNNLCKDSGIETKLMYLLKKVFNVQRELKFICLTCTLITYTVLGCVQIIQ